MLAKKSGFKKKKKNIILYFSKKRNFYNIHFILYFKYQYNKMTQLPCKSIANYSYKAIITLDDFFCFKQIYFFNARYVSVIKIWFREIFLSHVPGLCILTLFFILFSKSNYFKSESCDKALISNEFLDKFQWKIILPR